METSSKIDDQAQQKLSSQSQPYRHIKVNMYIPGKKPGVKGKKPVQLDMFLWWKCFLKHEEYRDTLRNSSNMCRLEIEEGQTLAIHLYNESSVMEIEEILEDVRKKFPQIKVGSVSTSEWNIEGLDAYLQLLQKHIDVVFLLDPDSDLLHFGWNQNKHPNIRDDIYCILDTVHFNSGFQFHPFAPPECVGKMVQDERFKNKCEAYAHCEVRFSVQKYGIDKKTIVTAMVHQQASQSVNEVFKFIDQQTHGGEIQINELKYVSEDYLGNETVKTALTKIFGTDGPVFWDIKYGCRSVAFCCVDERPTSDEIRYMIKIAPNVHIVKKTISDYVSKYNVKLKLNALGPNLVLHSAVVDNAVTDNAIDILVYCRTKDRQVVENKIETVLSQDTGSGRTTDKRQAPGQPQAMATKPTQTATSSTVGMSSK